MEFIRAKFWALFILVCFTANAQQTTFRINYDIANFDFASKTVESLTPGNIMLCGWNTSIIPIYSSLTEVNGSGNVLWSKRYSGGISYQLNDIRKDAVANQYFACGGTGNGVGILMVLNNAGTPVITRNFSLAQADGVYFNRLIKTSDGGYVVVGYVNGYDPDGAGPEVKFSSITYVDNNGDSQTESIGSPIIVKFDASGNHLWHHVLRYYKTSAKLATDRIYNDGSLNDVVEVSDGYIAVGNYKVNDFRSATNSDGDDATPSDAIFLKTTTAGAVTYHQQIDAPNTSTSQKSKTLASANKTSTGLPLIAGNDVDGEPGILMRLAASGGWASPSWIQKYSVGNSFITGYTPFLPNTFFETDDGNYATWAQMIPFGIPPAISSALLKVTPTGGILFGKQYQVSTFALLPTGQQLSDKGYVSLSLAGGLTNFDLQLVKADSAGNAPAACPQTDLNPTSKVPGYSYAAPYYNSWNANTVSNTSATPTVTNITPAQNILCRTVVCNPKPATPTVTANPNPICEGNSTLLSASGGSNVTYRFYTVPTGGTAIGTGTSLSVSPTTTTTYYVEAEDNSNPGCVSNRGSVVVTVNKLPDNIGTITGNVAPCPSAQGYAIPTVNYATGYTWSVPVAGGSVTSGGSSTNATITWTNAGTYVVTVTATNSCGTKQQTLSVTVQSGPPTGIGAIAGNLNPCPGSENYSVSPVANATNYVWSVSGGGSLTGTQGSVSNTVNWTTPGGPYTVSVTASNSCGSVGQSAQVTVKNAKPVISGTITGNQNPCPGNQNYSIVAVPNATSYTWAVSGGGNVTPSQNSANINWLTSGTYTVSVTAANDCGTSTATLTVTVKTAPPTSVNAITGSNNVCPGTETYSITPVTGATGYQWSVSNGGTISQGQGTTSINVNWTTPGGPYSVSVVASNDCGNASNTLSVLVQNPAPLQPGKITGDTVVCVGNGNYAIAPVTNATSYTWAVSGGGTITQGQGALNTIINWTAAGIYTVSVTATNSCGNSTARVVTVKVESGAPTGLGNILGNAVVCKGTATYSVTPISSASNYNWTVGNPGTIVSGQGTSSITVNWPNVSGTFPITVSASNVCGTSNTASLNVAVSDTTPPAPAVITGNASPCPGTLVYTISSISQATSYTWTLSGGGSIISGQGTTSVNIDWTTVGGPYTLSVSAENVCGSSVQTSLTINVLNGSAPVVGAISGDTLLCPSTKTYSIATVSGATGYVWSVTGGGTITSGQSTTSIDVNWAQAGSGVVSVIANGSCSNSTPATLNVTVKPGAPAQPGNITGTQAVCGGVSENYSIASVPNATNYVWGISNGGIIISGQGTTGININWGNSTGAFTISVYAENDCGQSAVQTIQVTVQPGTPVINTAIIGDTATCPVQQVYSIAAVTDATSYNWTLSSGGNILIGQGTTSVTVNWTSAGVHTLSVTASNSCGTSVAATIQVRVNVAPTVPTATAQDATICEGSSTVLTGSNSLGGNVSYNFYDAEVGGNLVGASPLTVSPTITTTYYLESVNEFGCRHSGTRIPVTVTVVNAPKVLEVKAENASVCYGDSTVLTATASNGATITWWDAPLNGNQIGTGATLNTGKLTETTSYYASATNSSGCKTLEARKVVTVEIKQLPVVELTSDKEENKIFPQERIVFTANPSGYANYEFFVNGKSVQSGIENVYASSKLGDKDTVVVVAQDNGCRSVADTAIVRVVDFPNAFTPNTDGKNDVFLKGYDLVVLNRWGQELYKGIDGWDGTFKGKKVSPGTYFYIVEMESITDRKSIVKGTVLLIQD
ncbi:MAG TPA: PKD domain-containing protein [Chitinophagales bacterium]|nr:PKD domain-containing protein [Chitinophagales bacterium]